MQLDSTKFLTLDVQEAYRIIPMELRITGYTRAGLMPVHDIDPTRVENINILPNNSHSKRSVRTGYFRPPPVIHFSGSSIGSDRGLDDGRTVEGSVQLIGGGEVRWHMVSDVPIFIPHSIAVTFSPSFPPHVRSPYDSNAK